MVIKCINDGLGSSDSDSDKEELKKIAMISFLRELSV